MLNQSAVILVNFSFIKYNLSVFIKNIIPGFDRDDVSNVVYPPFVSTTSPPFRPRPPPTRPQPQPQPNPYPNRPLENAPFRVRLNDRVILKCKPEGDYDLQTDWRRSDRRNLPQYSYSQDGDLIIENVQYDASGQYECFTYDLQTRQPIIIVVANVIVEASPPKISFDPQMPINARTGESIIINCNATGEPPISVEWHLDSGKDWQRLDKFCYVVLIWFYLKHYFLELFKEVVTI